VKVAIKRPGKDWEHKDIISSFTNLQAIIGGYIESVPNTYTNAVMYADEEGLLKNLNSNFLVYENPYDDDPIAHIVGTVIMFGPRDEEGNETDLTMELFEKTIKCIEAL
jgi:hypothetical protein